MVETEVRTRSVAIEGVTLGLWLGAIAIPLLVSGPQLLVGSIVNCLLFLSSTRLDGRRLILMAVLPSLAAVGHGVLFGGLTAYLIYLLPFIWAGNLMLMIIFKGLLGKWMGIGGVLAASMVKAGWLFLAALFLAYLKVIPMAMVGLMGFAQLVTALIGGAGVLVVTKRK